MAFHFPLMPRMYMALAREDRFPITDIMRQTPQIPDNCQWAIFLRNHDELTLEMVTDSERDYLWETYAADRRARINLGIRRRLAPLLERDRRRIELMNCLLLSMPGTPVIYYGDEIGMGDNIHLGDRDGVRTPMQWSPDRNGGFSRADPAALVLPTDHGPALRLRDGQCRGADCAIRIRCCTGCAACWRCAGSHAAFGRGTLRFLYPKNRKVLAYPARARGRDASCASPTSSRTPQAVELDLSEFAGRVPVELNGGSLFPPIGQLTYLLTLPPYGFYWFILAGAERAARVAHAGAGADARIHHAGDCATGSPTRSPRRTARRSCATSLPAYLAKRRWFSAKDQTHQVDAASSISRRCPMATARCCWPRSRRRATARRNRWQLPLSVVWDDEPAAALPGQLALARVRRGRRIGLLTDAFALPAFAHADAARAGRRQAGSRRRKARSCSSRPTARRTFCAGRPTPTVLLAVGRAVEQLADRRRRRDAEDLPQASRPARIPKPRWAAI